MGVLDVIGGSDVDPQKIPAVATVLARILTTPPSQLSTENRDDLTFSYFQSLSVQVMFHGYACILMHLN